MAAGMKIRAPEAAANEVPAPVGGWEALQRDPASAKSPAAPARKPAKISQL